MQYLVVLGREAKISLAELEALFSSSKVKQIAPTLAIVTAKYVDINRLGGALKVAKILDESPLDYLSQLPEGKITLGVSDYSPKATQKSAWTLALKYKNLLKRHGRNVRLIPGKSATISTATAHHNQLGEKLNHIEIIKFGDQFATSVGTQNITSYAKRDQARPARDAFVGMLPPKLAQILINLATGGAEKGRLLDPFCGTGVVLQEASLMGYQVYGTDLSDKMIKYSERNLSWLAGRYSEISEKPLLEEGDATTHQWKPSPDFVASEIYLGHPMSQPPVEIKFRTEKESAEALLSSFLKNIGNQIDSGATLALAIPAWLRPNGKYSGLDIIDRLDDLGYNLTKYRYATYDDLLYYREGQIVARQIIVLRKK
ncbi:hypothetical protein IKF25_02530 [Candidatus Saccharibacteria bacterium]|nr:hypothetical protein [Candidatus Saccharibacteria bacterium]